MYNIYYHFQTMNVPSGRIAGLAAFDLSDKPADMSRFKLRLNDRVAISATPVNKATYPKLLRVGDIHPALYFEMSSDVLDTQLDRDLNICEIVGEDGTRLSESAIFAIPKGIDFPIPNPSNISRVGSTVGQEGFAVSGATWYANIRDLAQRECIKLAKSAAILDWGVGCGRVVRYFLHDGFSNVHGIDIDQVNIDWCNTNLPGGKFARCDFDPPTTYCTNEFDLVYAHSVFTHLDEKSEASWLAELARILKPDGLACITFGSEYTATLNNHNKQKTSPRLLWPLAQTGRQDFGADAAGVDDGRKGYYRLVSHSREYVMKNWSSVFNVVRIIPGFANHQDAVLLKPKPAVTAQSAMPSVRGGLQRGFWKF